MSTDLDALEVQVKQHIEKGLYKIKEQRAQYLDWREMLEV